jgi:hypothetical protein
VRSSYLIGLLSSAFLFIDTAAQTPHELQCPLPQGAQPDTSLNLDQKLLEQLNLLEQQTPACLQSSALYARRGELLLKLKQPQAAIESFERSILINPDQPGLLLDYALALNTTGDGPSAQNLLKQIAQRTDLPPTLQALLQQAFSQTDNLTSSAPNSRPDLSPSAWRHQASVSVAAGTDSNLNSATSLSELTLTSPNGNTAFALDDNSRAHSGSGLINTLQWQAASNRGQNAWLLQADLRQRSTGQTSNNYQRLDASAQWMQAPQKTNQWAARLAVSQLDFGGQSLLQSTRGTLMHQWSLGSSITEANASRTVCRPILGYEIESRTYRASTLLDGTYNGVLLSLSCELVARSDNTSVRTLSDRVSLSLRSGQDIAQSSLRPGGGSLSREIYVSWQGLRVLRGIGPTNVSIETAWQNQQDASTYSPLLNNGETRATQRNLLRIELSRPLPQRALGGALIFVNAEISRQESNIELFRTEGRAFYTGLRWLIS